MYRQKITSNKKIISSTIDAYIIHLLRSRSSDDVPPAYTGGALPEVMPLTMQSAVVHTNK